MKLTEHKTNWQHYFLDEQYRRQGEYKDWWLSGQLWEISHYRDDKRHGERRIWDNTGQLLLVCHYRDDMRHGEYKTWHGTGQLLLVCHYRDDMRHGEYKQWDSNGELCHHTFEIDGKQLFDFIKNPEQYPITSEEKTVFVLKHGSVPFIGDE